MRTLHEAAGWAATGAVALVTALSAQTFDPLFRVTNVKGVCEVRRPDDAAFAPAVNGKAYPLGTAVRTGKEGGEAVVRLSADDGLRLQAQTEVAVLAQEDAPTNRLVRLAAGKIQTAMRDGLPERAVVVETAVAACDALAGRSDIAFARNQEGLLMEVVIGSGSLRLTGPQFAVPRLKAGCAVRVLSAEDRSLTRLTDTACDYQIALENGTDTPVLLDATAKSTVRIWREHAPVGGRLVVSVFAAGPDGKNGQNFAYTVGRSLFVASEIPATPEEHGATGGVAAATAPASRTNTPAAKDDGLWK